MRGITVGRSSSLLLAIMVMAWAPAGLRAETGPGSAEAEKGVAAYFAKDYATAMDWYRKADAKGNTAAGGYIGSLYSNGLGVPKDEKKGLEWFLKSANAGNADAQVVVGSLYENGTNGVAQDYKVAIGWFRKAAVQGNATGERFVGLSYALGNGVTKDYQLAMNWLQKSLDHGDGDAKEMIANLRSVAGNIAARDYGKKPVVVSILAGTPGAKGSADGAGAAARFNGPFGVAVGPGGVVYVADSSNDLIRKIDANGVVTTFAGSGAHGAQNGVGRAASFAAPAAVAVDGAGNVYVADTGAALIRKIAPDGMVTTLAGRAGVKGAENGQGTEASFYLPGGVAVDGAGIVYVADDGNNLIRKITPQGLVTTLAGSGEMGCADGAGTAATFASPRGIAVDGAGNVYVADLSRNTIRKITPEGLVTTLAGSKDEGSTDDVGAAASFNGPQGLAADAAGNVYVADTTNGLIRKITPKGVVTTVAGQAGLSGTVNGKGSAARFFGAYAVAVDSSGTLYVGEGENQVVRKIR